jgi:hypothetical protein
MTETPPTETDNLVLCIPDALRGNHWPELPGTTTDAVAAGPYTPACLPTLLTGRPRSEHGIQWFVDDPVEYPTVFDLESEGYDVAYWDSPRDAVRRLTRAPPLKSLGDMEPPFVFVARLLWTHTPYNVQWDVDASTESESHRAGSMHSYEKTGPGAEYIQRMQAGSVDFQADYAEAVEKTRQRIWEWRNVLKDRDLLDDTTFIVEADHGDAWGGVLGVDDCTHQLHTDSGCNKVMEIRATVLERDIELPDPLRQKNTLALWDERWRGGRDDLAVIDRETPDTDGGLSDEARDRLEDLGYL